MELDAILRMVYDFLSLLTILERPICGGSAGGVMVQGGIGSKSCMPLKI